ncbi:exodeoxyribonuclease V subunit RecD [Pararobbsia alpina]|uniref:exodeoxyribonuclease V subunit alpha n=1 Tax=Pararobbsia alpina TaxID=621374 RepID=UPI0039A5101D
MSGTGMNAAGMAAKGMAGTGPGAIASPAQHASLHLSPLGRMQALLASWVDHGWLRRVDLAFADFLARELPDAPPLLLLGAALASHQLGRGHACLDLAATLENPSFALSLPPDDPRAREVIEPAAWPAKVLADVTLEQWRQALSDPAVVGSGAGETPLVLVDTRLYLRRYWQYERNVRRGIARRLSEPSRFDDNRSATALRAALDALFEGTSDTAAMMAKGVMSSAGRANGTPQSAGAKRAKDDRSAAFAADWQKLACALAARSAFSIVTGGPGTGKTTTVVKLLALLQAMALGAEAESGGSRSLRIRLAAPTGKAAARLNESIAGAVGRLPLDAFERADDIRAAIPVDVTTLHRLLGTRPGTRRFRHNAEAPLSLDVLVIDEASMVDLEMMSAVLDALPPHARLILLGDKDQLASVEAGAVLGELCRRAAEGHYTSQTQGWLEAMTGEHVDERLVDMSGTTLDQAVAMLRQSHRFKESSGIGQLAAAVNAGSAAEVAKIWTRGYADIAMLECSDGQDAAFSALVVDGVFRPHDAQGLDLTDARDGYRHYLQTLRDHRPDSTTTDQDAYDAWAREVLRAHGAFQLLCALRRGPWGVEGLNRRIESILESEGLIEPAGEWYLGRPVLVTRNDYELGLMNGDMGITLGLPADDGTLKLRVAFPAGDGTDKIKWVLPSRLQAVETVFALTVHKSQGSEFLHAALVLPDAPSPVLTRELVYTGITRARAFLTLATAGGARVVRQALAAQVLRASGLSTAFDEIE